MKAFHVRVNGRVLCTAGVGEDGVVSVILTWVGGKPPRPAEGRLRLAVGKRLLEWQYADWPAPNIGVGDQVTVKILEFDRAEPEAKPN